MIAPEEELYENFAIASPLRIYDAFEGAGWHVSYARVTHTQARCCHLNEIRAEVSKGSDVVEH